MAKSIELKSTLLNFEMRIYAFKFLSNIRFSNTFPKMIILFKKHSQGINVVETK